MIQRDRKLTRADVLAIRASHEPGSVLAARYGVSQSLISRTRTGITYPEVEGPVQRPRAMYKLTKADAQAIRNSQEPRKVLAARYGVSIATIGQIRRYHTHA